MMKKNRFRQAIGRTGGLLLAGALALSLAACGGGQQTPSPSADPASGLSTPAKAPSDSGTAVKQTAYPITVKDATGTELVFDKAPERIVTIAPSETETVFAVGAGSKVVGVDKWSDYPEEAKSKPSVGDMNTNIEALLATKPDLVIAHDGLQHKVVEQLRELKIKVYASNTKTLDQTIEKIETFGLVLNTQEQAKKVTDKMKADRQKVMDAVKDAPKKKVYMEFSPGWTVGDGEYLNELLALAGGVNVAAGKPGWYKVDPEAIIQANPEVILYGKGNNNGMGDILAELKKRPGFDQIDAMKAGRTYPIDDNLTSRVGPRMTEALLEMAKAIHPDRVKQ
ncbi:ABC transporter substrate-binding protein [Paenibacillus sp. J31TS4]|uniref:ABC transporter substrate-binding protein n=1 Tax=Paenibacillus sp. J31TS4 TaxID=2807195 RepID=UPI001B1B1962|nr:ABC transporter substrate-binding protein [Paenibacillus sp. J31TS4]GIP38786.1 ABC transporter substrate-binding protein [Paenibacillus sp. J31TS4]